MSEKRIFALIGKNISYSFSAKYFTEKFRIQGIDNAEYLNFDLSFIGDLFEKIRFYRNLKGFNVTIPYKEKIIPYLDELDSVAEQIGAVNVVKILSNNKLKGYNTDCYGFEHSVRPLLKSKENNALILGTGGASKAIRYVFEQMQIPYKEVSRNPQSGQFSYLDLTKKILQTHNIIVNCTPLGTFPNVEDCPPIAYDFLTSQHLLYDLIYNPQKTKFLNQGESKGATVCNGQQMLILQAEESWRIWNT